MLSHKGFSVLYYFYIEVKYEELINTFITKYNLKKNEEFDQLNYYIKNLVEVFTSINNEIKEESKLINADEANYFNNKTLITSKNGINNDAINANELCHDSNTKNNEIDIFCFDYYTYLF